MVYLLKEKRIKILLRDKRLSKMIEQLLKYSNTNLAIKNNKLKNYFISWTIKNWHTERSD